MLLADISGFTLCMNLINTFVYVKIRKSMGFKYHTYPCGRWAYCGILKCQDFDKKAGWASIIHRRVQSVCSIIFLQVHKCHLQQSFSQIQYNYILFLRSLLCSSCYMPVICIYCWGNCSIEYCHYYTNTITYKTEPQSGKFYLGISLSHIENEFNLDIYFVRNIAAHNIVIPSWSSRWEYQNQSSASVNLSDAIPQKTACMSFIILYMNKYHLCMMRVFLKCSYNPRRLTDGHFIAWKIYFALVLEKYRRQQFLHYYAIFIAHSA